MILNTTFTNVSEIIKNTKTIKVSGVLKYKQICKPGLNFLELLFFCQKNILQYKLNRKLCAYALIKKKKSGRNEVQSGLKLKFSHCLPKLTLLLTTEGFLTGNTAAPY